MVYSNARELLLACSSGGSVAEWEEFKRRFEPRLAMGVRRAFRLSGGCPRPDQLEDLVQESYCRLLEKGARALKLCRSDNDVAVGAYLSRVAERVAIDHLRATRAEKRGGGNVESLEAIAMQDGESAWPVTQPQAEDRLIGRERLDSFISCCRRIAGRQKERNVRILRLALFEGLTSREISERIGNLISPNGIDSLLHRARLRLEAEGFILPRRRPVRAV